jgi:hypothetical protein
VQCGLDKAFGFAIRAWRIGLGANMPEAQAAAQALLPVSSFRMVLKPIRE